MRGEGKAKAPDNVTQRDATTNEWRGVKRGGGAGWREATGQHYNQLNKWGAIAQQKVEVLAEGFGKAERMVD